MRLANPRSLSVWQSYRDIPVSVFLKSFDKVVDVRRAIIIGRPIVIGYLESCQQWMCGRVELVILKRALFDSATNLLYAGLRTRDPKVGGSKLCYGSKKFSSSRC